LRVRGLALLRGIRWLLLRRLTLLWGIRLLRWLLSLVRRDVLLRIGLFRSGLLPGRSLLNARIGRRHGSLGAFYGYRSGYRGDISLLRGGGGPGARAAVVDDLHASDEENILVTQNPAVGLLAAFLAVPLDLGGVAGSIVEDQYPVTISFNQAMTPGHTFFTQLDLVGACTSKVRFSFRQRKGPVTILLSDNKMMVHFGSHEVFPCLAKGCQL
jgi:hypothetical protein